MILDGHFGDTGAVITDDRSGVVFDDAYRSNLWTSYLKVIGKPTSYNPETDPALNSAVYGVLKGTEVWDAYLGQQGLLSNFDPDAPPNNPPAKGGFYWFQYLKSLNLATYYDPATDPSLTPAQKAQFIADFEAYALAEIALFHTNFLAFASIYQQEQKAKLEAQFLQFIQGSLIDLQTQDLMLQSPDEIKKRLIMFETFETLLQMLLTLQNTIGVVGRNLIFYGKWQEQYTNMLTRVPIYTGGTSSLPKPQDLTGDIASIDFSRFTFGYNDISVEDIGNWYVQRSGENDGQFFAIQSPNTVTGDGAGGEEETFPVVQILFRPKTDIQAGSFTIEERDVQSGDLVVTRVHQEVIEDATLESFKENFVTFWQNATVQSILTDNEEASDDEWNDLNYGTAGTDPDVTEYSSSEIPWLHTFSVEGAGGDDKDRNDFESKARGEINAKLQQYIENIRSRRQLVQNAAKQIESTLSQSKESISAQANLLTSILDALKSLIGSIFR